MNGVHDMGGMENLGPIVQEADEPVFHHAWEGRVHALTVASPTRGNIDAGRHQRELIPGPEYLAMSYYEKWFRGLTLRLLDQGFMTPEELARGRADPGLGEGHADPARRGGHPAIHAARLLSPRGRSRLSLKARRCAPATSIRQAIRACPVTCAAAWA